jgi:hypothetical protein
VQARDPWPAVWTTFDASGKDEALLFLTGTPLYIEVEGLLLRVLVMEESMLCLWCELRIQSQAN